MAVLVDSPQDTLIDRYEAWRQSLPEGRARLPRRIDTFMMNDELDMLECRLVELGPIVDWFVIVEADVDHQDHPKPFHLSENLDRFKDWSEKLVVVRALNLPTAAEHPNPWTREMTQREHVFSALAPIGALPDDIVFHGDIDEIPSRLWARNMRPVGTEIIGCTQILYSMAVDWRHPEPWQGTVAARIGAVESFAQLRNTRNLGAKHMGTPEGGPVYTGWHLSWLGGTERQLKKLGSFCHPEVADRILAGLTEGGNRFLDEGFHADLVKMEPVDVDHTWPQYVYERRCPASWFRARHD